MYGNAIGGLWTGISTDGINFTPLDSLIGQQQSSSTDLNVKLTLQLTVVKLFTLE